MSESQGATAVRPSSALAETIHREAGVNVNMCFQCGRCAVGCPVAFAMDHPPAQLIHALRLGVDDFVLRSKTLWLCASCETCTTRCPQDVDIARVMDAAKIIAIRRGLEPSVPAVGAFYQAALANIRRFGRMWEVGMIASLKLRTGEYTKDIELGRRMLGKRKLKLLPTLKGSRRAARIFARVRKAEREEGGSS